MELPIKIVECGCCDGFHREQFQGDCREDKERFASPEQAANRLQSKVNYSGEIVNPGSDDLQMEWDREVEFVGK